MSAKKYEPLTIETLADRLGSVDAICKIVGDDSSKWKIDEVGDGNLNLVYTVSSNSGDIIVKQALPYVRLVGDSWPLPLSRSFYEHEALVRQAKRDPGSVPQIFYFNKVQAIIAMEMLLPHVILRKKLIAGEYVDGLAQRLGKFCARTAFRGSDLSLQTTDKKSDTALFQGNLALMGITESLVFTEPYFAAEMNHHTDGLDPIVKILRSDVEMKSVAQTMLLKFTANTETLCHGDLHSGSVMCTDNETKVIDPEFGFYGPMGFDIGMLISNYLMAYFSQPSHRESDTLLEYQTWILKVIEGTCEAFQQEFKNLWNSERTGILFPRSMFEDQGDSSEFALNGMLEHIWQDAVAISGIEMHRRVLSLAHNADFEEISDTKKRSQLEARNLMMGRELILNSKTIKNASELTTMARKFNSENYL
jgi:5-methylthioribose kinase